MASLYEYFVKDGSANLTIQEKWELKDGVGRIYGDISARLHLDFDAGAKYVSFYIPALNDISCPEVLALNQVGRVLAFSSDQADISAGYRGYKSNAKSLFFTGKVYVYSDRKIPDEQISKMIDEASVAGHNLEFRGPDYAEQRNVHSKPKAFISHDTRDKIDIAQPIATALESMLCPVWYDEYSLSVGDSLRESIEKGLMDCHKCILILTPNFLNNNGWTKTEYNSIFTRELVEKQKRILPVWNNVSAKEIYKYSPTLADRVAVNWSSGLDEVVRKLMRSIDK